MPIQPYAPSNKGITSKLSGIIGGAETGASVGGPYGAVIGGILGAKSDTPGGNVAKIGMSQMGQGNPMQRRMDSDPSNPVHQQAIQDGLDQLPHSGLPQDKQDHIASILIAGQTHGPGGFSTDHLFDNQPGQSYVDQSTGD